MCQGCIDKGFIKKETADLIEAFTQIWPQSINGPGHIVLEDNNVDTQSLIFCLDLIEQETDLRDNNVPLKDDLDYSSISNDELLATKYFLLSLWYIPESER